MDAHVLDRARELMDAHADLQARDAVHAAVVLHHDMEALCSYDRDFDCVPGIVRRDP